MQIATPLVQDYLYASRRRFAGMTLPDSTPVLAAISQAHRNADILGLEALSKVCKEAKEMAELREQHGLADLFNQYGSAALSARATLL